jgi:cell division protein FtsB
MESLEPTSRAGISTRWLILVSTFFIVAITLAPPLQRYFSQRAQINALSAQVHQSNAELLAAQKQLQELSDPTYIESQARSRLHFIFPGERQYLVVGLKNLEINKNLPAASIATQIPNNLPWYGRLIATLSSTRPTTPANNSLASSNSSGGSQ